MVVELPAPIAAYFSADKGADAETISHCFSKGGIVRDEGQAYIGREAIRRWKTASSTKYNYTAEPFAVADEAGSKVVTARLAGDFPGSPIDLRYRFTLDGERIAALEIGA